MKRVLFTVLAIIFAALLEMLFELNERHLSDFETYNDSATIMISSSFKLQSNISKCSRLQLLRKVHSTTEPFRIAEETKFR